MEKDKYLAGEDKYDISYNKLSGKKVKDILGYVSDEFGDSVFSITEIIFEDGSNQYCEGKHDFPYLRGYSNEIIKRMEKIIEEDNLEEE